MKLGILAWTGYWIGLGIELFIILICAVILALMLTGMLFAWIATYNEQRLVKTAAKAADAEARAVAAEEAAALAEAQAEAEAAARAVAAEEAAAIAAAKAEEEAKLAAAKAEEEARLKAEEEALAKAKAEEAKAKEEEEAKKGSKKTVVEETVVKKTVVEEQVVKKAAKDEAAAADATAEGGAGDSEFVVVHDGIVFNDSKTITELYEELSAEQQGYFDELREEALQKPDSELAISKNFVTVKIGKRNLIKLLIKRGVTVAEFMLENEALKQLRLSNMNKRGKSSIKVKPTVVQVLDLPSLRVAVDTLNLAYEELMND